MNPRRQVLKAAASAAALLAAWPARPAASRHRVVVVGGGMAGTTVAKYLRLWSGGTVDVTLVDRNAAYTSCIMSSLVLTGQRSLGSLQFGYRSLRVTATACAC